MCRWIYPIITSNYNASNCYYFIFLQPSTNQRVICVIMQMQSVKIQAFHSIGPLESLKTQTLQ